MNQLSDIVPNIAFAVGPATVSRIVLALLLSVGVVGYVWFVTRRKNGPRR
jgi:alpha-D-ribose 1-methylphosphonate 5-triphosphate synthase subunit PhnG